MAMKPIDTPRMELAAVSVRASRNRNNGETRHARGGITVTVTELIEPDPLPYDTPLT